MSDEIPVNKRTTNGRLPKAPKPRPTTFKKGNRANPAGRPRGSKNKATLEAKAFWSMAIHDPEYQALLLERLKHGLLPPAIETMGWYYASGKPTETVQMLVSPQRLAALDPDALTELKDLATQAAATIARLTTD